METKYFKKVIDECATHKSHYSIRLSWRGEPFLHPEIFDLIRYAKKKGIKEVSTLTHGGFLNEEKFKELMDAGLDWLTISHDGTGKEYEKIRAPLKYEESLAKIKRYHEIKKERKSVKPVIKIQGIWPAIEKGPEEFYETFSPIVDQVIASPLLDFLRVDTEREYIENFTCPVLYQRLTIGSTGEVYLCVNDEMGSVVVGDVKKQSVEEIWKGKKLQKAREIHLKHLGVQELSPCKYCMYPRKTKKDSGKVGDKKLKIDNYTNRPQVPGI